MEKSKVLFVTVMVRYNEDNLEQDDIVTAIKDCLNETNDCTGLIEGANIDITHVMVDAAQQSK